MTYFRVSVEEIQVLPLFGAAGRKLMAVAFDAGMAAEDRGWIPASRNPPTRYSGRRCSQSFGEKTWEGGLVYPGSFRLSLMLLQY